MICKDSKCRNYRSGKREANHCNLFSLDEEVEECAIRRIDMFKYGFLYKQCRICGVGFFIYWSSTKRNATAKRKICYSKKCRLGYMNRKNGIYAKKNYSSRDFAREDLFLDDWKMRTCLYEVRCNGEEFMSRNAANRMCDRCKVGVEDYWNEFDLGGGQYYDG